MATKRKLEYWWRLEESWNIDGDYTKAVILQVTRAEILVARIDDDKSWNIDDDKSWNFFLFNTRNTLYLNWLKYSGTQLCI